MDDTLKGDAMARRPAGTGNLYTRTDAGGRETYYATWYVDGRKVKRRVGAKRLPGTRDGLTLTQAEGELRRLIGETLPSLPRDQRMTVEEAGRLYVRHLQEVKGRKPTTVADYKGILANHFVPFTAGRTLDQIDAALIEEYVLAKLDRPGAKGLSAKTVRNHLVFIGGLYRFAMRRKWVLANPISEVDPPETAAGHEIRFLTPEELAALYRAVPRPKDDADEDDPERIAAAFWGTDRVLFRTAAMTGLRQGELIGLRWRDVDWTAGVVRVRQTFTHGAWSTPKSKRSSRAVPMADVLARELEIHSQASPFKGDGDLVFGHPVLGAVLDASALRKRFKLALARAELRAVRFHDLRHSFGTAMAGAGAPMRAIQEWMGHASITTTEVYADYSPDPTNGAVWAARAFATEPRGSTRGSNLSETEVISEN